VGKDQLETLNKQVEALYRQGKFAKATKIAQRSLALIEQKFGLTNTQSRSYRNNLALLTLEKYRCGVDAALWEKCGDLALGPTARKIKPSQATYA
jgi:hypothetical protein